MYRILKKTRQFIFTEQRGVYSSTLILSLMIVVSRIFGFIRYRILAGYFVKEELDIFFASFRIPDLVFEILITGALTSALIPIFIKYQKNQKQLEENISSIFNLLSIALAVGVVILFLFMGAIIPAITPGFSPEKTALITFYSRVLLLGQIPFLVLGNFLTGLAQAKKTFLITAIAPVLYNVAIILGTIFFIHSFHLFSPILGVVIGAFLFFLIQVPLLFTLDFEILPIIKITAGVREFFRVILPRILTVLVYQIDATVDLTLTTLLGAGSYTVFYLAQHLQFLPVSIFGMAYGQASLPYLSELYRDGKIEQFKKTVVNSILSLFFFTVPVMGFFIFARTPLVRLFFGGDKFDWPATVQTAATLSFFAFSLPLHTVYYFVIRCFYAVLDSRTPFFSSFISIALNALLSVYFILVLHLPVWSLAISFSISVSINTLILIGILDRRLKGLGSKLIIAETVKICTAMFLSSFVSYYLIKLMDGLILDTTRTLNVFILLLISGVVYVALYLFLCWFFNVKEMYMISGLLSKAKDYRRRIVELYTIHE